jgi:hypothetical protein
MSSRSRWFGALGSRPKAIEAFCIPNVLGFDLKRISPRPDEVLYGKAEPLSLCDQKVVCGLVKVRRARKKPEIPAVRSAHHHNAIVRIKIENPVVSLT